MTPQPTGRVNRFGDLVEDSSTQPAPAQRTTRFGDVVETPAQKTSQADTKTDTATKTAETKSKYLPLPEVLKVVETPLFRQKPSSEKIGWLNTVDPEFKKLSPKEKAEFIQNKTPRPTYGGYSGLSDLGEGVLAGATRTGQHLIRGIHNIGALSTLGKLNLFPESAAVSPEEAKPVTTPPPTKAGKVGYGVETLGEFALPIPGLSALKLAKAPGVLNAAARFGVGTLREGLDVGLKTLAQTGDPKEALETGTVAGPIGGAVEAAAPFLSNWLKAWAKSQYAQVLHPLGRAAKEVAEEQIPRVVEQGYRPAAAFTRTGLFGKFQAKVDELGPLIAAEYKALDASARTRLVPIYQDIDAWMRRDVFTKFGAVKDPELYVKAMETVRYLQSVFGQHSTLAFPSEVWEIRRALDKYVYRNKLTADASVTAAVTVKREVGNIIRNQLNQQHPNLAELNDKFHMWRAVAELMRMNIRNELGKQQFLRNTGLIGRWIMGAGLGGEEAHRRGASPWETGAAAALGGLAFQTVAWRTVSAVTKDKIANLLASGNGVAAANLAARAVGLTERATDTFASPQPTSQEGRPTATSPPGKQQSIPNLLADASKRYGVPLELLHKVAQKETGGLKDRATAVSPKGAIGVMQIMPSTAKDYGLSEEDLKDPAKNIDMSARYLRWILDRPYIAWDQKEALRAYNAGVGHVQRGEPDTKETLEYVK